MNLTDNAKTPLHSQSLNNVNNAPPNAALACANNTKRLQCRPASIVLACTDAKYKHPVLKLCPSTPTPSESESSASQLSPCCNKSLDLHSKTRNSLFPFSHVADKENAKLMQQPTCRSCKTGNTVSFSPNSDSNLGAIVKNTNSNAKHSLLVPFTSNAGIIKNIITTQYRQQHHCPHRSLNEINCCVSNNNSPNLRSSVSPNSSVIEEMKTSGNVFGTTSAMHNRSKISPTPSRTGAVATPASIQSQSDSLSSATTISTATTIIPKEIGEMARRSSDSDLSVTPKGRFLYSLKYYKLAISYLRYTYKKLNFRN